MPVKILCIGDVVGSPGMGGLEGVLPPFVERMGVDMVICNAENAADGSGLIRTLFDRLRALGVDVVTMGDHIYRKKQLINTLKNTDRIIRPANLAAPAIGRRWSVVPTKDGAHKVGVTAVVGQIFMTPQYNSPFEAVERSLAEMPKDVKLRFVEVHAEATSEKVAMGWHLDGRVTCVYGTHTHIPTADARVLPKGTAYITDLGMTGPYDSVLGRRKDRVIKSLTSGMPQYYEVARRDVRVCGVLVVADEKTGKALDIQRFELQAPDAPREKPKKQSDDKPASKKKPKADTRESSSAEEPAPKTQKSPQADTTAPKPQPQPQDVSAPGTESVQAGDHATPRDAAPTAGTPDGEASPASPATAPQSPPAEQDDPAPK